MKWVVLAALVAIAFAGVAAMKWVVLAALVAIAFAGVAAMASQIGRLRLTRESAARLIEGYADGQIPVPEWDRFTSVRQVDAQIEQARMRSAEIGEAHYSGAHPPSCLSAEGAQQLRDLAAWLRETDEPA